MKKLIGIIENPDGVTGPMAVFYNGPSEPMTAEYGEVVEDAGYTPTSEEDARAAAAAMWSCWPWEYVEA